MALTTLPPAGAKLRAATLSGLITEVRELVAIKTADETVNNSSTLQNDDELFLPVEANAAYLLELAGVQNSGATPDFKLVFSGPSGASGQFQGQDGATIFSGTTLASTFVFGGAAADALVRIWGRFVTSSTAGTLQVQWAQNVTNASNTVLRAATYLRLVRYS